MDTQQKLTRWRLILGAQTDSEFQKLDPDFKLDRRSLALDAALAPGQWRELTEEEVEKLRQKV